MIWNRIVPLGPIVPASIPDAKKLYVPEPLIVPLPVRYALPFVVTSELNDVAAKSMLAGLKFIFAFPVTVLLLLYLTLIPKDTLPVILGEALEGLSKLEPP